MGQIKVDCDQGSTLALSGNLLSSLKYPATDISLLACFSSESLMQMHLLTQAQMLIKKNNLYEAINQEINGLFKFQSTVFSVLPCQSTDYPDCERETESELPVLSFHRDAAISALRFLSVFYDTGPNSFFVATNLIDRLLSKIAVPRKALPIVATCCFYLATCYTNVSSIPIDLDDLMKLTQCETTKEIFLEVVGRIRDEVNFCQQRPITPLSFLKLFYSVFELQDELLQDSNVKALLTSRLELLLCHFEFTKFRYDLLALAFLHYFLRQIGFLSYSKQLTVLELQYYCRMDEGAYRECFSMIEKRTFEYETQATKRPKLKLTWTVSRRVLLKRRPSLLVRSNLEPIGEEESMEEEESNSVTLYPCDVTGEDLTTEAAVSDPGSEEETKFVDKVRQIKGEEGASVSQRDAGDSDLSEKDEISEDLEDAELTDGEITTSVSPDKFDDEHSIWSKGDRDYLAETGDDEIQNNGDSDESKLGGSYSAELNRFHDFITSMKAPEVCEFKSLCDSWLNSEPSGVGVSILLVPVGDIPRSLEPPSSTLEGGGDDNRVFVDVAADESYAKTSGGNVPAGCGARIGLLSDDNNNCIMGIV